MIRPKNRTRPILYIKSVLKKLSIDLLLDPHDVNYVLRRLQQEGPSFVTKILPKFSAYAVRSCDLGRPLSILESGLTHFSWSGRAPRFMRGLLLEAISGNSTSLWKIRQFCDYMYKLCFGYSDKEIKKAEAKYVATDESLMGSTIPWDVTEETRVLFENLFPRLSRSCVNDIYSVRTRYGPGSFCNSKWHVQSVKAPNYSVYKKLPSDLVGLCPKHLRAFSGYFKAYQTSGESVKTPESDRYAELQFVPKDSRGPRVISMEPPLLLKAQMAYQDYVSEALETESNFRINFRSQETNQELCRKASIDRTNATIDLEEASDRINNVAVKRVYRNSPGLLHFAVHARSTHVCLPSGRKIRLRKFANMGSGLCFPTLALVVYLRAVIGVHRYYRSTPIKECAKMVYVYGDDLIVPRAAVESVFKSLQQFDLKENANKSYYIGYFRESCGADYYHGEPVMPTRLRLSGSGLDPIDYYRNGYIPLGRSKGRNVKPDQSLLQLERHCRELVDAGLTTLSDYYYSQLERYLGDMPKVSKDSAALGRYDPLHIANLATKGYIPVATYVHFSTVCPYKGIGAWSISVNGLGQDWSLTPERHSVSLKCRVLEPVTLTPYGLAEVPDYVKSSVKKFTK